MEAVHIASAARPEQFPAESAPEIAFLGRSNVGKSSLLNTLVGKQDLAFTSSRPGCTQLINFFRVAPDRGPSRKSWYFVDLPGYGYARVPEEVKARWKSLIESYLLKRQSLTLSLVLLDARRGWMERDLELKRWLEFQNLHYMVVATKTDKLNRKEEQQNLAGIRKELPAGDLLIPFSAVSGRGVRELWQAISKTRNRP
jgi:GTP-binding protein